MALVSRARGTFYGQRTGGAPHRRAVFIGFGPLAGGAAGARERSLKSSHFVAPLFEYRCALLDALRHPRIVAPEKNTLSIHGLAGFLMERAGVEALAQRLTREGRLSLDLLQRFGEDLLEALQFLEEQGVTHRDLKPDNVGIAEYGKNPKIVTNLDEVHSDIWMMDLEPHQ